MKKYSVSYRINQKAWLNKEVEAETAAEAKAKAKEYFIGIFGKDKIAETYKIKENVVVVEIIEKNMEED